MLSFEWWLPRYLFLCRSLPLNCHVSGSFAYQGCWLAENSPDSKGDAYDREHAQRETQRRRDPLRDDEPKVKDGKTFAVFLATQDRSWHPPRGEYSGESQHHWHHDRHQPSIDGKARDGIGKRKRSGQLSASFALANPVARLTIDAWLVPVMVPMVLGLTAVFTAWRVPRPILRGEKYRERFTVFYLWFIITQWVTPSLCFALSMFAIIRVAF